MQPQVNPMQSLYLAWQAPAPTRAWFTIGRLSVARDREHPLYVYQYTEGALRANKEVGLDPLPAFPDFRHRYEASELFPLFKNRVIDPHRRDFADYLRSLDLDPRHPDPIEILAVTGGIRQTDSFEVFPKIEKAPDGGFSCRFFLHGLRHVSEEGQRRGLLLQPNEALRVSLELDNPVSGYAIQLASTEYQFLGWAPRYLVMDLLQAISQSPRLSARVVRVNETTVPLNRRILVELSGKWPEGYDPMSGREFQTIH